MEMAEYIERSAAIKAAKHAWAKGLEPSQYIEALSAADVAPVVRCKDCVHWDDDPDTYGADYGPKGKCMKSFETMRADDFCSYGERKDGADG